MQTYYLDGTVHIGLVGHEALFQVIDLAGSLEDFGLKVTQGRVVPARTRTVLVLDTCNLILLDHSEYGLVGIYLLSLLLLCVRAQSH